jgi:SPX domain protein involved in polyphosphate accumulation
MGQAIVPRIRFPDRYELKYLLDRNQYEEVAKALATHMEPDPHSEDGRYLITSLYYDTADYKAFWEKINGYRFRRKVRVRVYNTGMVSPDSLCFVEIKQRRNKTVQKKRVVLPYSTAVALCGSGKDAYGPAEADRLVIEEVQYLYNTLRLQPACVVSYDRLALEGSEYDPGLRVTFDTNLKCRAHDLTLLSQGYAENRFFAPPQWCVMEVKVNSRVPYWMTGVLSRHRCTLRRISKYCAALEHSKALLHSQRINY